MLTSSAVGLGVGAGRRVAVGTKAGAGDKVAVGSEPILPGVTVGANEAGVAEGDAAQAAVNQTTCAMSKTRSTVATPYPAWLSVLVKDQSTGVCFCHSMQ